MLGWFKSLPEEVIRARPQLCGNYGWSLMLTGQLDTTAPYLDCAERALQGDDEQLGQIVVAQAYLARVRGDYPRAIVLSRQAMNLVSKEDVLHRGLVTFTLGFSLFSVGHIAEAERQKRQVNMDGILVEMEHRLSCQKAYLILHQMEQEITNLRFHLTEAVIGAIKRMVKEEYRETDMD